MPENILAYTYLLKTRAMLLANISGLVVYLRVKDRLHWRHLLAKLLATATRDSHLTVATVTGLFLPWPPWAAQHR